MGARAIDETIPTLLEALRQPGESSGTALQALREVMTVRMAVFKLYSSSIFTGSSHDSFPCPHPNVDCHPYDGFQC